MAHPKQYTIIINSQPFEWQDHTISYQQLVQLAFPGSTDDYIVTYTHGHKETQLTVNSEPVKVKDGMEFDVDGTHNS